MVVAVVDPGEGLLVGPSGASRRCSTADARADLARSMAATVVRAARPLRTVVVCDDEDGARLGPRPRARRWSGRPGLGLNGAVEAAVDQLAAEGVDRVVVAHADLPLATDLAWVADERRRDPRARPPRRRHQRGLHARPGAASRSPTARELRLPRGRGPAARARPCGSCPTPASAGTWTARGPRPARRPAGHRMSLNLPTPAVALAIAAHPDDVEFGCGGHAGQVVGRRRHRPPPHLHRRLEGELGPAARTPPRSSSPARPSSGRPPRPLGATGRCVFLGWPDGELDSGLRQRWEVAYWIRRLQPTVVLGHDPWKRYRLHPDHRHAGLLAVEGIVAARDPHFFPEQALPHHRPDALLLFEADEAGPRRGRRPATRGPSSPPCTPTPASCCRPCTSTSAPTPPRPPGSAHAFDERGPRRPGPPRRPRGRRARARPSS